MKCKLCKKEARINLRSYNLKLCNACFIEFFKKRVRETTEKFKMCSLKDVICLAASGGKDSFALWDVLHKLGYETSGLFIDLGIDGYSRLCREKVVAFSQKTNLPLKIVDIKDELGYSIREVARRANKVPCSICGMVKRYIMNRETGAFDCLATGHTLDDEASVALGNILQWQTGYLERQYPVLQENQSLKKKIKPFTFTFEKEIKLYAQIAEIEYVKEKCPFSANATSLLYKKAFDILEERMPHIKLSFYKKLVKKRFFIPEEEVKLRPCRRCGYLTVDEVCNFCKLKEKLSSSSGSR